MIETRIPIAPDTSTTLTDEITEHIVNRKVTIKIDRDYLKKKYAETIRATGKNKTATLLQEEIISTQKKAAVEHICKCTRLRLFLYKSSTKSGKILNIFNYILYVKILIQI